MSKLFKNILGYYPKNTEGTFDENNLLACTHLKFYVNPLTEYQYFTLQLADLEDDIIQNIDRADQSIYDVTPFNILHNNFSLKLLLKPEAKKFLYHILKKLQLNADQGKALPYLMFEDKNDKLSLLEQAINNIDLNLLNILMEFCIKQDHLGLLYADYISPCLYGMKKTGYDLKPLFESSIFFYKVYIKNPNFPYYQTEYKYCIIHSNENKIDDVIFREKLKFEIEEKEEDRLAFKIEYYIVNLKDHINNQDVDLRNKIHDTLKAQQIIQLFDELSDKDITYLDIELLQVIINFKWKKYTYNYFLKQFLLWLLFIVIFIIDLVFGNLIYGIDNYIGFYVTRGICQIILLKFFYYEIYQITLDKHDYFSSLWNIQDFSLQLIFPSYIFVSFYWKSEHFAIKSLQCVILLLAFIKFLFFLRIFKRFSFLIQMLATVLNDITSFLYFFGFVVIFFSILVGIILKDLSDYEGVGPVAYFVIAMRESIGDYDTDSYSKNTDYKIIGWIVYVMVMFLGNVIFMNFIIAVVGQSYENCMQRSVAQSFKVKLHMIKERESMMSESDYEKQDWFPNYIILCKPLSEGRNSDNGEMENDWNGLLKEIEKGVKRQFQVTNLQQRKMISSIESDIKMLETKESSNEIKKQIYDNNFKMDELNQKMKQSNKKIEQKMEQSDKKMEEIKIEMKEMKQEMNSRFEELKILLTKK